MNNLDVYGFLSLVREHEFNAWISLSLTHTPKPKLRLLDELQGNPTSKVVDPLLN